MTEQSYFKTDVSGPRNREAAAKLAAEKEASAKKK
jgi:hypothetical protein